MYAGDEVQWVLCLTYDAVGRVPDVHEAPTFVDTWKDMEKLLETGASAS